MHDGLDLSLLPENRGGEAWVTVHEGDMLECVRCGKPFTSVASADKIEEEVGDQVEGLAPMPTTPSARLQRLPEPSAVRPGGDTMNDAPSTRPASNWWNRDRRVLGRARGSGRRGTLSGEVHCRTNPSATSSTRASRARRGRRERRPVGFGGAGHPQTGVHGPACRPATAGVAPRRSARPAFRGGLAEVDASYGAAGWAPPEDDPEEDDFIAVEMAIPKSHRAPARGRRGDRRLERVFIGNTSASGSRIRRRDARRGRCGRRSQRRSSVKGASASKTNRRSDRLAGRLPDSEHEPDAAMSPTAIRTFTAGSRNAIACTMSTSDRQVSTDCAMTATAPAPATSTRDA